MSSETNQSLRLPVIDFSAQQLKPRTPEWESVRSQVHQALEEFGCFEALFDKNTIKIKRDLFESVKELFDLPLETKKLNVSNKPFYTYGYGQSIKEELPYEAMTIDGTNIHKNIESFTNISWPQGNSSFCNAIQSYTDQLSELDQTIRRMIFESLGIEKYFEDHLKSTNYTLRMTKYKELEFSGTKNISLRAHTDQRLMNILSQNQVDGLEIQTKDGHWICVKPSPISFVVILGQAFSSVLANGRLHCPVHRVTMSGNEPRYSVGLFSDPNEDYLIKTPEELVDEEHPLMYKPYYFFDFYKFFMADVKNLESALKAYCGV